MDGKEKCRYLRSVRKSVAEENNIDMDFEECTYEGECRGTCPKCDSELEFLNRELEKRKAAGEDVVIPTNKAKTKSGFHPIARLEEIIEDIKSVFDGTWRLQGLPYSDDDIDGYYDSSDCNIIRVGQSDDKNIYHSREEIEAVENGPLAGLELSEMSLRLLMRSGKNSVKDVLEMDEEALSRLKDLNENCYCELIYKVHFWELKFDYENKN